MGALPVKSRDTPQGNGDLIADHSVHLAINGDEAIVRTGALRQIEIDVDDAFEPRARSCVHDADLGRENNGLVDVVSDEEHGLSGRLSDAQQLRLHGGARVSIESCERLIHEQDLRLAREHTRNLDTLLHAAGQLLRMLVPLALKADELKVAICNGGALGLAPAAHLWTERDVAGGRKPWIERIIALEHDPAIGAGASDGPSTNLDVAASRQLETGNHIEDGRLATAAGAEKAEEFPRLDVEVEMVNGRVRGSL